MNPVNLEDLLKTGVAVFCCAENRFCLNSSKLSGDINDQKIVDLIGSRFVADPEFRIDVNGKPVEFKDLKKLATELTVQIEEDLSVQIRRFDAEVTGRTSKQSGIAWWVNNRLVGRPSWKGYDGTVLDARHNIAKRYVYIVIADLLVKDVKPDWSGFYASALCNLVL